MITFTFLVLFAFSYAQECNEDNCFSCSEDDSVKCICDGETQTLYVRNEDEQTKEMKDFLQEKTTNSFGVPKECKKVNKIVVGSKISSVGSYSFFTDIKYESITLGEDVTSLHAYSFSGIKVDEMDINVNSLGYHAFQNSEIKTLVIDNDVETIEDGSFYNCSELTTLTIGDIVQSINGTMFFNCSKLQNINLSQNNQNLYVEQNVLFNFMYGQQTLVLYPSGLTNEEYIIPNGARSIEKFAFQNCKLKNITIGPNVDSIKDGSFYNCPDLMFINIDSNTNFIVENNVLFSQDKTQLILYPSGINNETYEIPDDVTKVSAFAFQNCKLKSITLSQNINTIEEGAFYNCLYLTNINIVDNDYVYVDDNVLFKVVDSMTMLLLYPSGLTASSYTIPDKIDIIGTYAFQNCKLKDITISSDVGSINSEAFSNCLELEKIKYLGVTDPCFETDASNVFVGSAISNKEQLELQEDYKPDYFCGIPYSNNTVCNGNEDSNIVECSYNNGVLSITGVGVMKTFNRIEEFPFYSQLNEITAVVIDENINYISYSVINELKELKEIEVITGNNYFKGVEGVLVDCSANNCNTETLENMKNSVIIKYPPKKEGTEYSIPSYVKELYDYSFENNLYLKRVIIHKDVDTISESSFKDCFNMESFTVDSTSGNYFDAEGVLYKSNPNTKLIQYPSGKTNDTFNLSESVTEIGEYAFRNTQYLENIYCSGDVFVSHFGGLLQRMSSGGYEFIHCPSGKKGSYYLSGIEPLTTIKKGAFLYSQLDLLVIDTGASVSTTQVEEEVFDNSRIKHMLIYGSMRGANIQTISQEMKIYTDNTDETILGQKVESENSYKCGNNCYFTKFENETIYITGPNDGTVEATNFEDVQNDYFNCSIYLEDGISKLEIDKNIYEQIIYAPNTLKYINITRGDGFSISSEIHLEDRIIITSNRIYSLNDVITLGGSEYEENSMVLHKLEICRINDITERVCKNMKVRFERFKCTIESGNLKVNSLTLEEKSILEINSSTLSVNNIIVNSTESLQLDNSTMDIETIEFPIKEDSTQIIFQTNSIINVQNWIQYNSIQLDVMNPVYSSYITIDTIKNWGNITFSIKEGMCGYIGKALMTIYNNYPPNNNYFNISSIQTDCCDPFLLVDFGKKNPNGPVDYLKNMTERSYVYCGDVCQQYLSFESEYIRCKLESNTLYDYEKNGKSSFNRISCPCEYTYNEECAIWFDPSFVKEIILKEDIGHLHTTTDIKKLIIDNEKLIGNLKCQLKEIEIKDGMNVKFFYKAFKPEGNSPSGSSSSGHDEEPFDTMLDINLPNKIQFNATVETNKYYDVLITVPSKQNNIEFALNTYAMNIEMNENGLKQGTNEDITIDSDNKIITIEKAGIKLNTKEYEGNERILKLNEPTDYCPYSLYVINLQSKSMVNYCDNSRHPEYKICGIRLNNLYTENDCQLTQLNCLYENDTHSCSKCEKGFILKNGKCTLPDENCLGTDGLICTKCKNGFYYNYTDSICTKCRGGNVVQCNVYDTLYDNYIDICEFGYSLNISEMKCEKIENVAVQSTSGIIQCENGFYLNGTCQSCSGNCTECSNQETCTVCKTGYELKNDKDQIICKEKEVCPEKDGGICFETIQNCKTQRKVGYCEECNENMYPINDHSECVTIDQVLNCTDGNSVDGCLKCDNTFYLDRMTQKCYECDENCVTCEEESTYCTSCSENQFLSNNHCYNMSMLIGICEVYHKYTGGCVKCIDGYYRNEFMCEKCDDSCSTCLKSGSCLICKDGYYLSDDQCLLKSTIVGCSEEIQSDGCHQCLDGMVNKDGKCLQCPRNCRTCDVIGMCTSCVWNEVLVDGKCMKEEEVEHVKEIKQSKITKCSFWYGPSDDGTFCTTKAVWWVILIGIILILLITMIIALIAFIISRKLIRKTLEYQYFVNERTFEISKSEIIFPHTITKNICCTHSKVEFENDDDDSRLVVGKEINATICIGNLSKSTQKIQLIPKTDYKYEMSVSPDVAILKKGYASEFTITLKPLCSFSLTSEIAISIKSLKKGGEEKNETIPLRAETQMSTRLDPEEIVKEKQIGEGSFGIVFIGKYRGNKVAIKKMKTVDNSEDAMVEFGKEVAMLDKFRCEYIIHFYGASFIPNQICLVTEFAEYGSLNDLIQKRRENPIDERMRIKILIDAAKGIDYLHSNGILHRDIKPDNILVTSLDEDFNVNGKLTDFGSARNINLLQTNLTFTKGVGTPAFMAPEILKREHYKMPADIYSFAITMFECIKWGECYPSKEFTFPWDISDFVSAGKRSPKPEEMDEQSYSLICACWSQDQKERPAITQVIKELSDIQSKL